MMNQLNVGKFIAQKRKVKNLTQVQLAEKLGVSNKTISPEHPVLKENADIFTHSFEGGKYAVYHFKGFPQFLFMVYQEIFCRWLSNTGNQLDERPIVDIYRKVREDEYMEIDICFPLK